MRKALFLFADYYDATTVSRRVLAATKPIFDEVEFLYWGRLGAERESKEAIFSDIPKLAFTETAKPRSMAVLGLFFRFQFWILKQLKTKKPQFVIAFTFYTILPALVYKYVFNRSCKVVYDPRDYVSVSYNLNQFVAFVLNFTDNLFIKFSDLVIFPDRQYFIYYGRFKLKEDHYFILPNSAEDLYDSLENINIYEKYKLPQGKNIIPILGYFEEARGEKALFDLIQENDDRLHFVFAGDFREEKYLLFFDQQKENVSYLNKIPYTDALVIIKESLIIPQLYDPQLLNNVYAYPTKYYDCLMVGTPMIVSTGQIDVFEEIIKYNFGFGIVYNDLEGFKKVINDLIENKHLVDKKEMRRFFLKNYDYNLFRDKLKQKYLNLLQ